MATTVLDTMAHPYHPSTINNIDYKQQRQQYQLDRKSKECTQFGVAWSPPSPSTSSSSSVASKDDAGRYLFSCLDSGIIACWDVFGNDSQDLSDSMEYKEEPLSLMGSNSDPILKIQASQNVLYNIYFYQIPSSHQWFLSICGDDGVFLYKWVDIYTLLQAHASHTNRSMHQIIPTVAVTPYCHYHTYPASNHLTSFHDQRPSSILGIEVNSTSIDASRKVLFGAAGDIMGSCYQWDIETGKILGTLNSTNTSPSNTNNDTPKRHTDFLHSVCVIPGGEGHVLTGGDDGNMGMWDSKQNKLIDMIHCGNFLEPRKASSGRTNLRQIKRSGWVSGIHVEEDGCMAALCGGLENSNSTSHTGNSSMTTLTNYNNSTNANKNGSNGGFVALWHLPTRSILSSHTTREEVQSIYFHPSWDSLVTVANENVVSYWSWSLQTRQERVWCSSKSCFGVAVNHCGSSGTSVTDENGMMAVCGVGDVVDCYSSRGNRCFSLAFR